MLFESFHLLCFPSLFSQCLTFSFLLHLHSLWKFRSFPCRIYFLAKFYCCFPSLFLLISTLFWQFVVTFVDKPLLPYCFSDIPECICLLVLLSFFNHVKHISLIFFFSSLLLLLSCSVSYLQNPVYFCSWLYICFCFYILLSLFFFFF